MHKFQNVVHLSTAFLEVWIQIAHAPEQEHTASHTVQTMDQEPSPLC